MADNKEGAIRGNISSMDGKSTEDMGEEKLEQEIGCLCLRSVRIVFIRIASFFPLLDEADPLPGVRQ